MCSQVAVDATRDSRHDRRSAARYPVDTRVFALLGAQTVRLCNISRTGVAIAGTGLATGTHHLLQINLNRHHLALQVEIVDCDEALLHARFVQLEAAAERLIAAYVDELGDASKA